MDLKEVLSEVIQIKGLTSVALVGDDGFVIESASGADTKIDLEFLGGVAASSLIAGQSLADFFGKGEVSQIMVEFEEGPVLLAPLGPGEGSIMVTLDSSQNLGRVRFQLKKYLPQIVAAAKA